MKSRLIFMDPYPRSQEDSTEPDRSLPFSWIYTRFVTCILYPISCVLLLVF
jgi:hypothetical protein